MDKKKWLIQLLFIVLMLGLFVKLNDPKEVVNVEEVSYLKQHAKKSIEIAQTDLNQKEAFILSELHGFKENTEVKLNFIKYLHAQKGITTYLAEVSYSTGFLLNEYLKNGDYALLNQIFSFYKGSTFYTEDERDFYKRLYEYNALLEENDRIQVFGIDIEHAEASSLYFYTYYTGNTKTIDVILKHKTDDPILNHLKNNIIASKNFYQNTNWEDREVQMYQNVLFAYEQYKISGFYAQVGAKHGYLDLLDDKYQSLAYYLNTSPESPVKDKVLSVMMFYKNSKCMEMYSINDLILYRDKKIQRTYNTANLDILSSEFQMVNLHRVNSPFHHSLIWYDLRRNENGTRTTHYYQYLILLNHSAAQTPIDKKNISYFDIIKSFF